MESFACKDLGLECDFAAKAPTRDELLGKVMEHGGTMQADLMQAMTPDQAAAFQSQLVGAIKPA